MCSIVVYTDYKRPQFSVVRDSLACHYAEMATDHYFTIVHAAVVSCDEPLLWQKKPHESSRTV